MMHGDKAGKKPTLRFPPKRQKIQGIFSVFSKEAESTEIARILQHPTVLLCL